MNLSSFDPKKAASKGADLYLKHPATGEVLRDENGPAVIHLIGRESPEVDEVAKELRREWMKSGEEIDSNQDLSKQEKQDKKAEIGDDMAIKILCAATVSLKNVDDENGPVEVGGGLFDFYKSNQWITTQALSFFQDRKSFFPKGSSA